MWNCEYHKDVQITLLLCLFQSLDQHRYQYCQLYLYVYVNTALVTIDIRSMGDPIQLKVKICEVQLTSNDDGE